MPRPGTAVHLQEVAHREQLNGSPAPGIPPCAHELKAVWPTRSGFKEECPRSRESREQATQADRKDIFPKERPNIRKTVKFGTPFASGAPPCARGLRAVFRVFLRTLRKHRGAAKMLREHSGAGRALRKHRMLPPSREHSGSTAEHGERSGSTECFSRAQNTLGAPRSIESAPGAQTL